MKSIRGDQFGPIFQKGYPYLNKRTEDIYLCTNNTYCYYQFMGVIIYSTQIDKIGKNVVFQSNKHLIKIVEYHGSITIIN